MEVVHANSELTGASSNTSLFPYTYPGRESTSGDELQSSETVVAEGLVSRRRDLMKAAWSFSYFVLGVDGALRIYKGSRKTNVQATPKKTIILTDKCTISKIFESKSLSSKIESKVPGRSPFPSASQFRWILKIDHCNWNGTHQGTVEFAVKTESQARQWREKLLLTVETAKKPESSLSNAYNDFSPPSFSTANADRPQSTTDGDRSQCLWLSMGVWDGISVSIEDPATKKLIESNIQSDNFYLVAVCAAFVITFCVTSSANMTGLWSLIIAFTVAAPMFLLFLNTLNSRRVSRNTTLKVSQIVESSPREVLSYILRSGDQPVSGGFLRHLRRVQKIDNYTDVMHLILPPIRVGIFSMKPRDLCLMRYWRQEEDGSYLIVMSSTKHLSCPPSKQYIRAHIDSFAIHIGVQLNENESECKSCKKRSLCAVYVRYDTEGWKSIAANFGSIGMEFSMSLLRIAIHLRDEIHELGFTSDASWFTPPDTDTTGTDYSAYSSASARKNVSLTAGEYDKKVETDRGAKLVRGLKRLPCSLPQSMWAEPHPSMFQVRGPNYLDDQKKIKASASPFHLVGVDLLSFADYLHCFNVCSDSSNIVHNINAKVSTDGEVPYTFVVNFVLPGRENLCLICYFQPIDQSWRDDPQNGRFLESFLDFIDGDDDYRNSRFKLIPVLSEGGLILKKTLGSQFLQKPTLPGKKGVKLHHYRGDNSFEVDVDIGSEAHARDVAKLLKDTLRNVVIDIAVLFEAQEVDELPEMILGTARLNKANLSMAKRVVPEDTIPPSIKNLLIRDRVSGKRVMANSREPISFETEMFVGKVIFKFATNPVDPVYAPYFEGKKRMFEVQVQGRFKEDISASSCLLGLEGTYHLEVGLLGKGLVHLVTKFVYALTPGAQANLGDKHLSNEPCLRPWILCMPLSTTVDCFIETPPGADPPALGVDMLPEVMTKSEWSKLDTYSADNIYSISMHGMYVDFVKWNAVGIPGIGATDLKKILGSAPLRIVAFATPPGHNGVLTQADKRYLFDFELCPPS
eukprot:CFRG4910T1